MQFAYDRQLRVDNICHQTVEMKYLILAAIYFQEGVFTRKSQKKTARQIIRFTVHVEAKKKAHRQDEQEERKHHNERKESTS